MAYCVFVLDVVLRHICHCRLAFLSQKWAHRCALLVLIKLINDLFIVYLGVKSKRCSFLKNFGMCIAPELGSATFLWTIHILIWVCSVIVLFRRIHEAY